MLTVDTMEQALARVTGGSKRDTGRHAVEAALASLERDQRTRSAGAVGGSCRRWGRAAWRDTPGVTARAAVGLNRQASQIERI